MVRKLLRYYIDITRMGSAYEGIFTVLDELGIPDLKQVIVQHCIQDRTLQYMETEDELKNLLREINIPLGQCIPIIKLWIKWCSRINGPEVTQGGDKIGLQYKVTMVQQAIQATVPTVDAITQTYEEQNAYSQHPGVIGSGYNHPQGNNYGQYSLVDQMNSLGLTNHIAPAGNQHIHNGDADIRPSFMPQQTPAPPPQVFEPQLWTNNLYNYQPANEDLGRSGWLGVLYQGGPIITSGSREVSPIQSPSLNDMIGMEQSNDTRPSNHRINSFDRHNDVLDEREDLAIERSLVAEEKQQSYAAALKEKQIASAKAADNKEIRPRSSSMSHPSPPPLSSPPASFTSPPPYIKSMSSHTPVIRPKDTASTFSKCDEISVENATSGVVGNNLKDIGTASLRSYLEKLMASQEYIEATSKPKSELPKGWLPIDGKHILSARKIQFKPMFIDDKGRMRHGVSVRGADKSEECSRHTVGKAPAYCTFAHSRIGDTLQFICIKCSCEKSRYTYCQDKKDHREYIFNLGPYKNINGEPWKLTT